MHSTLRLPIRFAGGAAAFAAAIATIVLVAGTSGPASARSAYSYPWCAKYYTRMGGTSCYFTSYAQCQATVSGIGGYCFQSPYYQPGATSRRRRY
jgi:hypothetical protein